MKTKFTSILVLLTLASLLLAACGPARPETAAAGDVEATRMVEAPAEDVEEAVPAAEPVIVFQQEGGFAGLSQTWEIFADGTLAGPDDQMREVDPETVAELLAQAETADFAALEQSYIPKEELCCDRFTYTITIAVGGETKTVQTIDDAPGQPPGLAELIGEINALITGAATG